MKMKSTIKYLFCGMIKSYAIYGIIIVVIMNIAFIISASTGSSGVLGGIDFATVIFLIILGISSNQENMGMAVQNGVSRRTFYLSTGIVFLIIAAVCSAGDTLMCGIGHMYSSLADGFNYQSSYEQAYLISGNMNAGGYLKEFITQFTNNTFAVTGGFLIAAIFTKMSKVLRIVTAAVVYVVVFIIIPIIDAVEFEMALSRKIAEFISWIGKSFVNLSITNVIGAVLVFALSFVFVRRAKIADRK